MKRNGQVANGKEWKKIRRPFTRRKQGEIVSFVSAHDNGRGVPFYMRWDLFPDNTIGAGGADQDGNLSTDEEGNLSGGYGGVYDPKVLPSKIRHWWTGTVPNSAPAR